MKNCQGLPQTKAASLSELLSLLKSLMSKGRFPASLLDSIYGKMSNIVTAQYSAGRNGSSLRSLVDQYLPAVQAQALAESRRKGGNTSLFGSGGGMTGASLAGLVKGSTGHGSFFDPTRSDPYSTSSNVLPAAETQAGRIDYAVGGVAVGGVAVTSDEISDYFNGVIPDEDDSFSILLWLGSGKNPMLMLEALSYAKRLHNDVVLPCATYYKQMIYGDPNYPVRLGQIVYGIVSQETVRRYLRGGPTSRHLVGQAANFRINGVEDHKVVEDLTAGKIRADYGTLALTAAIHVSLPFFSANDAVVRKMTLWSDSGVPNFVGYKFS